VLQPLHDEIGDAAAAYLLQKLFGAGNNNFRRRICG
jgi:hypothetical protein